MSSEFVLTTHGRELSMEEYAMDVAERERNWWMTTSPGQSYFGPSPLEARDAILECDHGCLPHDQKKPTECRCWDPTPTPSPMDQLTDHQRAAEANTAALADMLEPSKEEGLRARIRKLETENERLQRMYGDLLRELDEMCAAIAS